MNDIAAWTGVVGAVVGAAGVFFAQRFQHVRSDKAVRREIRTALRLVLGEIDGMREHNGSRVLFVPRYRARSEAVIERFRRSDTALAYTDIDHLRVAEIVDLLSDTLHTIASDENDKSVLGYVENVALPSELDSVLVYEPLHSQLQKVRASIAAELELH